MSAAHILGFPRIGARRELKTAVESYWKGKTSLADLQTVGRDLRARHWALQCEAGLDYVTVGDFAWYDHLHNATALFTSAPARFGFKEPIDVAGYFAMARGTRDAPALAMRKWFDTNYHYLVPELDWNTAFALNRHWLLPEVREALALGHAVKVVLPGPLTWLWLASADERFDRLHLLPPLLNVYATLLNELKNLGVEWVQIDEPILSLDLPEAWLNRYVVAYRTLARADLPILLATYFGSVAEHAALLRTLPIDGLHLDLARSPEQLDTFLADWPADKVLSLGVIDGRNIWRADLSERLAQLRPARAALGDRLWVSASCSLLHVPTDLAHEHALDPELKRWMAFATQKLGEIVLLKRALVGDAASSEFQDADAACEGRRGATSTCRHEVRARVAALQPRDAERSAPFDTRIRLQRDALGLPPLPTTTIGSFPQTAEIRAARASFKAGRITEAEYSDAMHREIRHAVETQAALGLDVLVHGEAERNDMVEYFGEQLAGFAVHRERLGAELRVAVRKAAGDLRRCFPAGADDDQMGRLRPESD